MPQPIDVRTATPGRRAQRLVAWGNAALGGHVSPDSAADRIVAPDTAHRVIGLPGDEGSPVSLPFFLVRLRGLGIVALRLALPVPGDLTGLPGPAEVNVAALEAGEAVLAVGRPVALLPRVVGAAVEWCVRPVARDGAAVASPSLAEADRSLREALLEATDTLAALDVARWRPELAGELADLRSGRGDDLLAPGYPPRAAAVASLARRLSRIADLALADAGGAVTGHELDRRNATLRTLARASRHAEVAAYNAVAERGAQPGPGTLAD